MDIEAMMVIGIVICGISFIWLFASFVNSMTYYSCQARRFEDLRALINKLANHKAKQKDLLVEFKLFAPLEPRLKSCIIGVPVLILNSN